MNGQKVFTLEEARELLPILKELLTNANADLSQFQLTVREANELFDAAESAFGEAELLPPGEVNVQHLRSARVEYEQSIDRLSRVQTEYLRRLNEWLEKIAAHGVILRDLQEGLLDFPCVTNGFEYLLCWRMDEPDIRFWHQPGDGFIGRRPLASLSEYF